MWTSRNAPLPPALNPYYSYLNSRMLGIFEFITLKCFFRNPFLQSLYSPNFDEMVESVLKIVP